MRGDVRSLQRILKKSDSQDRYCRKLKKALDIKQQRKDANSSKRELNITSVPAKPFRDIETFYAPSAMIQSDQKRTRLQESILNHCLPNGRHAFVVCEWKGCLIVAPKRKGATSGMFYKLASETHVPSGAIFGVNLLQLSSPLPTPLFPISTANGGTSCGPIVAIEARVVDRVTVFYVCGAEYESHFQFDMTRVSFETLKPHAEALLEENIIELQCVVSKLIGAQFKAREM